MHDIVFPVIGKERVSEIIAHKDDMLLLDSVYSFDGTSLEAGTVLDASNPFFRDGCTPSYVCFELIAQAICVYSFLAGFNGSEKPQIGFILKLSDFRIERDVLRDNERLFIRVECDCSMGTSIFSFKGTVRAGDEMIASGSMLVMSVADPVAVLGGRLHE